MNSESERKSLKELKEQARAQIQTAAKAEPCVTVTEPNWKALIAAQNTQVKMLAEIQDGLTLLATEERLTDYLNGQMELLEQYSEDSKTITERFQTEMKKLSQESASEIGKAMKETEIRVGSMKEIFSSSLSSERDTMKKYTKRLFWIALIPSLLLLALELTPHILQLLSSVF